MRFPDERLFYACPIKQAPTMKDSIKAATQKALDKRADWIKKQLDRGKTYTDIANCLDISRQRVHQICKEAGLK